MLKRIRIENIILVESAEIFFTEGLNVLSGETGSGKSAIMHAISLIFGDRSDSSLLRKNCEKGCVEAAFDIGNLSLLEQTLDEAGIVHAKEEELIVKREIAQTGKGRCWINHQQVQLSFLKKIGERLFHIVGQHANQKLFSLDHHRHLIDLYGDLKEEVRAFSKSWQRENQIHSEMQSLIQTEAQRMREIEICRMEMEEIEEANLKESEEEELFLEYSRLSNAENLSQKSQEICQIFFGERSGVLFALNRCQKTLGDLLELDPGLAETVNQFNMQFIELEEIAHGMRSYASRIEINPEKAQEINTRLSLINRLKKKYGPHVSDIHAYQKSCRQKLQFLENADNRIEELRSMLEETEQLNNTLAIQITKKRQVIAKEFESAITAILKTLNMPKVEFYAEFTTQKRTAEGDDRLEFFIIPNVGENKIPLKNCASGGELSRIMLALHSLLAGKEETPTLIFDEIDANIGGATATLIGERLKEIGSKHQVICITHFPQVAKQAKHHIQISKEEKKGRTVSIATVLDEISRERELSRMAGG